MMAFVVGGSGLIGSGIVTALRENDVDVYNFDIVDDGKPNWIKFNCISESDEKMLIDYVRKLKPDIFVNVSYPHTVKWGKAEDSREEFYTNVSMQLSSVCWLAKRVAEEMADLGIRGCIINFGSIYGVNGPDMWIYEGTEKLTAAAYPAVKAGIINFSKYLAVKYGPNGIRVNTISPGGVIDRRNDGIKRDYTNACSLKDKMSEKFLKQYCDNVPLGRMTEVEDVACAALYLMTNTYVTGQNIIVDGGWTCK